MKLVALLGVFLTLCCSGCNPFYVIQAGITQSEILLARRDIPDVVNDPETTPEIVEKLQFVTQVRDYSRQISLEPKGSFRSYSALDRDTLAWIVLAAKPDSFTFYTWWFPFVGRVPYKGYFSAEAATSAAKKLEEKGYETLVRGTEAFSTLGWFDDPVMTPMLRNEHYQIADTVLHEILHTTLWVPNYVAFNESSANFVGHQGAIGFFQSRTSGCPPNDSSCASASAGELTKATRSAEKAFEISRTLNTLIPELTELYQSSKTQEEKLATRQEIFNRHIEPLRQKIPELKILKRAHNAELMQLQLYYSKLDLFKQLWDKEAGNWSAFLEELKKIAAESEELEKDPFTLLAERLAVQP